jgi:hypothetical protein
MQLEVAHADWQNSRIFTRSTCKAPVPGRRRATIPNDPRSACLEEQIFVPLIDDGLDLDNIDETSQDEIDAYLTQMWRHRGLVYEMTANSIWLDNRPDFTKLHRRGARLFGRIEGKLDPTRGPLTGIGLLFDYIFLGWEVGILNQIDQLKMRNVSKAQIVELVMAAQIWSGMRGLESVYRAAGMFLRDYPENPSPPAAFPDGWTVDPEAFKCGLDMSTVEPTPQDIANIQDWYMRTIGEVPRSISFAAKYHPGFLKANRAKWENAFRAALPKQMMPYLMLRHNTIVGNRDGIREGALLGKAWGMTTGWIINAVMVGAFYFTGTEGLYAVNDALADVLD